VRAISDPPAAGAFRTDPPFPPYGHDFTIVLRSVG